MWSDHILPSLELYHRLHGDCCIPQSFVVSSEDPWPKKVQGQLLGSAVSHIRSEGYYAAQVARDALRLEKIGFVWDRDEYEWSERILPSLEVFFRVHGHCRVPALFVMPSEEPWPKAAWGLNLGAVVANMRSKSTYTAQATRDATRLERIKFVLDHTEHQWSDRVLPSLETFARMNRHCCIPQAFVVPREDPWLEDTWGLNLGAIVADIRSNNTYARQVARDAPRLNKIKFVRKYEEYQWSERILPSLETFCRLEGHSRVPKKFVVPSTAEWPEEAWGLKLGVTVSNVRIHGYFSEFVKRDRDRLDAINFSWDVLQDKWDEELLPAFEQFYHINGHCRIPRQFVVPEDAEWPEATWGLKLGIAFHHIRYRGSYAEQRKRDHARLTAIEFLSQKSEPHEDDRYSK